jgi:hypothetical protein
VTTPRVGLLVHETQGSNSAYRRGRRRMCVKRERRKVSSENGRKPGSCCCARSYIIIYGAGRKDRIYTAK